MFLKLKFFYLLVVVSLMFSCSGAPDKRDILVVGTYTRTEGHVNGKAVGIYVLAFDDATGNLSYVDSIDGIVNPSYVAFSHDKRHLAAVSETADYNGNGKIYLYRWDQKYSKPIKLTENSSGGSYPCHVSWSADNQVLVANYGTGTFGIFQLVGNELKLDTLIKNSGKGIHWRQDGPHGHFIEQHVSSNFIYTVDLGIDQIHVYNISPNTIHVEHSYELPSGSGPRHLAFHSTLPLAYVVNELTGTLSVIDLASKKILSTISTVVDTVNAPSSAAIRIDRSNENLYVSNRGNVNEIVHLVLDSYGIPTLNNRMILDGHVPRDFSLSPSENYILVAMQNTDELIVIRRDKKTGTLSETVQIFPIKTPVSLAWR